MTSPPALLCGISVDSRREGPLGYEARDASKGFRVFVLLLWVFPFSCGCSPQRAQLVSYMPLADYFAARTEHAPRICALRRR